MDGWMLESLDSEIDRSLHAAQPAGQLPIMGTLKISSFLEICSWCFRLFYPSICDHWYHVKHHIITTITIIRRVFVYSSFKYSVTTNLFESGHFDCNGSWYSSNKTFGVAALGGGLPCSRIRAGTR